MVAASLLKLPVVRTLVALRKELLRVHQVAADRTSRRRLATDLLLYRALGMSSFGMRNRERTVRLRNGVVILYRLNRGDINSVREVWLEEIYRMPGATVFARIVDLGANIGQASLYFSTTYGAGTVVAVEPDPTNAELARRNFAANGVRAHVVEAAIGSVDGTAFFADSADSNAGQLSSRGREVLLVSMPTLCGQADLETIDLLKIDVEGAEQALLSENNEWLCSVRTIVVEFHPDRVDYPGLVERVEAAGFARVTPESFTGQATELFMRRV